MTISLHHALVPGWIQIIAGLDRVLEKAQDHCAACDTSDDSVAGMKLAPDMLDFAFQVKSVKAHSLGAVEGVRKGTFSPDLTEGPRDFAGMRAMLAKAKEALAAMDPAEFEGFVGKPMEFRFGETVIPFDAEEFLLSFSQPNFYFHATAAYALLRNMGVPVGKRDYMGPLRFKQA